MAGPLLAVDTPSMLFRAFYALPDKIVGPDGRPVNALLGAANLILREVELHEPRAVVLCFGPDAAAYRTELYPAYHAEREAAMPDQLPHQFDDSRAFFEAFGWTVESSADLEADDLLGTYARREAEAGGRALLLTGDRDMYQCAGDGVTVLYVRTGGKGPAPKSWDPTRCASATASTPRRSPTSSPCAATPPTACRAPRAWGRRPPPNCSASTARWRRSSTPRSASSARNCGRR